MRWIEHASSGAKFVVVACWALGIAGCDGYKPVTTFEPTTDPAQLFMSLTVDHPAVNLSTVAPYNTQQLVATPRNALGEPLAGLPEPIFRLNREGDSTKVKVTSTGLLTAKATTTGSGILVLAELNTGENILRVDSTYVIVKNLSTPPVLASLSIDSPDSATWPMTPLGSGWIFLGYAGVIPFSTSLTPKALSDMGSTISGLTVEYRSLDPTIAVVNRRTGGVTPIKPGQVNMVAQTTAYGVTKVDTATFTVTLPVSQDVTADGSSFNPSEVQIVHHGYVFWIPKLGLAAPVAVTFDDPTNVEEADPAVCSFLELFYPPESCGTGDFVVPILPDPTDPYSGLRVRRFPVPGVYTYHNSVGGTGRVIVTPASD